MRFGGHETFHIREGWLAKALRLFPNEAELLVHEHSEDFLGVGRNMAKSIRHWVVACGLAKNEGTRKESRYELTEFGELVKRKDPHFLDLGTWWAIHVNLVNDPANAYSWNWFFNRFAIRRFERAVCTETLRRYIQLTEKRMPSPRTLDRDIGCLLSTYSRKLPPSQLDPEDGAESPLQELGLMTHFVGSGNHQQNIGHRALPFEIFGYSVSRSQVGMESTGKVVEQTFGDMLHKEGAPARVFLLEPEGLLSLLQGFEHAASSHLAIRGHAGERLVTMPNRAPSDWLKQYYSSTKEVAHA